jgi:ribosomal protein L24E
MDVCSWCGNKVDKDDGFRVAEPDGERVATFCRLEHVVAWILKGPHWEPGRIAGADSDTGLGVCAHCGEEVAEGRVLLVRHRGEHRIGDAFCSLEHLLAWTKRGGRWRTGV